MKRFPLIFLRILLLAGFLADTAAALDTFDERRRAVLETFAREGSGKYIRAECLFALECKIMAAMTRYLATQVWGLNSNRSYTMFSRCANAGGKPWQGQSYPCGVMWDEPDVAKGSHLWITSPAADEVGQMGIHTHGVRAYEQEILGRDSLHFLFQTPADVPFPYALGYVPGGHRAFINDAASDGRIFLHYGSVRIAITASERFQWKPSDGIRAAASRRTYDFTT